MYTKITDKDEFKVIGIEVRTTNADSKGITDCAGLWGKFFGEGVLGRIPNKVNSEVNFGVYTDYDEDFNVAQGNYTYIVCTEVSSLENIPEGMVGKIIPASKYAAVTAKGPFPQQIGAAWQYIWEQESWGDGYQRAFTADIEVYETSKYMSDSSPEMDIYISIK